jgi:predicted O-methyltransferase YrrM
MPLTPDFFEAVKVLDRNWSMGVELVSPLIYSLIRCTRPKSALEVGAGYSSLFMAQALAENLEEYRQNKELLQGQLPPDQWVGVKRVMKRLLHGRHPLPLALPQYYESAYEPRLSIIDDKSHDASSAGLVEAVAHKLQLSHVLQFYDGDFRGMSGKFNSELLPFDFVWFDCGGFQEYTDFLAEYWSIINPQGGLLLLHSTLTNLQIRSIVQDLKLKQATDHFNKFEMLSLLEPHKRRQNSVTMIRMLSADMEKIHTLVP